MNLLKRSWNLGKMIVLFISVILAVACNRDLNVDEQKPNYGIVSEWRFDRYGFLLDIEDKSIFQQVIQDHTKQKSPIKKLFITDTEKVGYYITNTQDSICWGDLEKINDKTYTMCLPVYQECRDFLRQDAYMIEISEETIEYQRRYPKANVKLVKVYRHYTPILE